MSIILTEKLQRFNYLVSEINSLYHKAALKFGLSDSIMHALYCICNSGDRCLLSDIYKMSGISKQTVNSAIRNLERDGMVYLENFDGKAKIVCLTNKGADLAKNTVAYIIEAEKQVFDSWPLQDQEKYIELTQRYLIDFGDKITKI